MDGIRGGLFTLEMADKQIERIRPHLERARSLKREIETIAAGYDYDAVLLEHERPRINMLADKLSNRLETIEALGGHIKDLDIGIVDFPCEFEGREVFLCWKFGEAKVGHWHEINEGFADRSPIIDLQQLCLDDAEFALDEELKKVRR